MTCSEAQLKRAAKYREANREKIRVLEHVYHIKNKEKVSLYKKNYYLLKKEWERLRGILLD